MATTSVTSSRRVSEETALESGLPPTPNEKIASLTIPTSDELIDGGYGWIVVLAQFFINAAGWGATLSFGVFLSYYRAVNHFPGATDIQFAFIAGLSLSAGIFAAPLANYLAGHYHFKVPMYFGLFLTTVAQILAAFSTKIWQLLLTQGLLLGLGTGFLYIPTIPIVSTWFHKKRALAIGLVAGGSGAGSLVLSFTTHAAIENLGLRWAFVINAIVTFVVLFPAVTVMKARGPLKFAALKHEFWYHPGFVWVWLWSVFSVFGFVIAICSLAAYSTAGLHLSQTQGATLTAILALGQMIGRPAMGLLLDRYGRITLASILTFTSGLACLVIWMFARSYAALVVFSIILGLMIGIFWVSSGPVTAEVVGIQHLASAMSVLWITVAPAALVAEPIALSLIDYSQTHLNWSGADAYLICIGFAGGCLVFGAILLLGAKRYRQGNWNLFERS